MDIVTQIQSRLSKSLSDWYPEFGSSCKCTFDQSKAFRWSEHYIFRVQAKGQQDKRILVKILLDTFDGTYSQDQSVRSSNSAQLEFEALSFIYKSIAGEIAYNGLTAVRPLAHYSDINALAIEFLPGKHLLSILHDAGALLSSKTKKKLAKQTAYQGGQLLGLLHSSPREGYPQHKPIDRDEFSKQSKEKISRLLRLDNSKMVQDKVNQTHAYIEQSLNHGDTSTTFAYLHGDYYPNNIVRLPDGNTFTIDTTLQLPGPVEQDLAKFFAGVEVTKRHLLLGNFGMNRAVCRNVSQAFYSGYQTTSNYNTKILLAYQFQSLLLRWIEILEVLESKTVPKIGTWFKESRVRPIILNKIDAIAIQTIQEKIS